MARYGVTVYSATVPGPSGLGDYYGEPPELDFNSEPFIGTCTGYGTIKLSWSMPLGDWSEQRLLRSSTGIPVYENDGEIIADGEVGDIGNPYFDTVPANGRFYYYALFVKSELNGWVPTGGTAVLSVQNFGYTPQLYSTLPEYFRSGIDPTRRADGVLQEVQDAPDPTTTLLYRFISIFGFQLDTIRTYLESLTVVADAAHVSQALLPSLGYLVGATYEPSLSSAQVRKYVAASAAILNQKGSPASVVGLASALTGWGATVSIGKNLALDNRSAGPVGDTAFWTAGAGTTLSYVPNTLQFNNPAGAGWLKLVGAGSGVVMNLGVPGSTTRRFVSIPVEPGTVYTASFQCVSGTSSGMTGQVAVTFRDINGNVTGSSGFSFSTNTTVPATGSMPDTISNTTNAAPAGSVWADVSLEASAASGNATMYVGGFQFEASSTPTTFEPARKIWVTFAPTRINQVPNPNGRYDTWGWAVLGGSLGNTANPSLVVTSDNSEPVNLSLLSPIDIDDDDTSIAIQGLFTATEDTQVEILLTTKDAAGDITQLSSDFIDCPAGVQTLVSYVFSLDPADAILATLEFLTEDAMSDGASLDVTDIQAEFTNTIQPYFDGDIDANIGPSEYPSEDLFPGPNTLPGAEILPDNIQHSDDYIWIGVPGKSKTYYYPERLPKSARLHELLAKFFPVGVSIGFIFGNALYENTWASARANLPSVGQPDTWTGFIAAYDTWGGAVTNTPNVPAPVDSGYGTGNYGDGLFGD